MKKEKCRRGGSKLRYRIQYLIYTIIFWNIAIRLAIFLRFLGYGDTDVRQDMSKGLVMFQDQILWASLIVTSFAIISWALNSFVFERISRRNDVRKVLASVFIIDTFIFLLLGLGLGMAHYTIESGLTLQQAFSRMEDFFFNPTILFFLIVIFIVSFVFQLLITFFQQVGQGVLWKLMFGYYRTPREENKIFLFLDLQSSTACAEKLGHSRYSDFLQECFGLLTDPLLFSFGKVYQYVGDEVVVTWDAKRRNNYKRAVDFYFMYAKEIEKRKAHFEKRYGIIPYFTASINSGKVMAAEVGQIKHELAFHGDVLNTAARIQKQCKRYGKPLLATEKFIRMLAKTQSDYTTKYVDEVKFLGKDRRAKLYEIF